MSKQSFLDLFTNFMFQVERQGGYESTFSENIYGKVKDALYVIEMLHFPRQTVDESPSTESEAEAFKERMKLIEARIAEKLYQHGSARQVFLLYDEDASGQMHPGEFRRALELLEIYLEDREMAYLIHKYANRGTGNMDYTAFLRLHTGAANVTESQASFSSPAYFTRCKEYIECESDENSAYSENRAREVLSFVRTKLYQTGKSLSELFLVLDADSPDGFVSLTDLRNNLRKFGIDLSPQDMVLLTSFGSVDKENTEPVFSVSQFADLVQGTCDKQDQQHLNVEKEESGDDCSPPRKALDFQQDHSWPKSSLQSGQKQSVKDIETRMKRTSLNKSVVDGIDPSDSNKSTFERVHAYIGSNLTKEGKSIRQLWESLVDGASARSLLIGGAAQSKGLAVSTVQRGLQARFRWMNKLRDVDVAFVLTSYDENGDGLLTYHEFVKMIQAMYSFAES